ncbi:MAG: SprT family zinc-dependent metalloprotease [Oligoflexia bacterium]|nr:SprT family zinc-dependent metalloprotease [Oligoflexia bacterium]
MKNLKVLFILLKVLMFNVIGAAELNSHQQEKVLNLVQNLVQTTHQNLNKENLKFSLYTIDNPQYFFVSNFGAARALLGKKNYRIGVNPLIFEKNIPDDALKGVVAHELVHTEDYESGSTIGTLIPIGLKVSFSNSRIQYERKTDLKVIQKGLAKELLAYKNWQYPQLSADYLEIKRKEYLTPEEIPYVKEINERYPELFDQWTKKFTPREMVEFKLSVALYEDGLTYGDDLRIIKKERRSRHGNSATRYTMHFSNDSEQDCDLKVYPFLNDKIKWKRKKEFLASAKSNTEISWRQFPRLRKVVIAPTNCPLEGSFFSYSQ